jgi:D-serine deaminase-like pyridoxal phosphate-dependent protein
MTSTHLNYETLRDIFRDQRLPLAFVDLDAFDRNADFAASLALSSRKTLRIGSKSLRCLPLMERLLAHPSGVFRGFLTFTLEETEYLSIQGHNDFVVAYPSVQPVDMEILARLTLEGRTISLMVDHPQHLEVLDKTGRDFGVVICTCLDIDMSYRPLGSDRLHLGLRRSPIRTPQQALELARLAQDCSHVRIDAVMGYEGHIAGTNDDLPGERLKSAFLRVLKNASVKELTHRRTAVIHSLQAEGIKLRLVNGGGSGSLVSTLSDPSVTEATIGSGLYAPGLFHHFKEVKYTPSAFFALQVVRIPKEGMLTCAGGGYIASGPTDASKAPYPVLPGGMRYLDLEGAGEVQTPLLMPPDAAHIKLGDPLFFQHAKAGELCERFNELYLIQGGAIVDKVKTYRGAGYCFL